MLVVIINYIKNKNIQRFCYFLKSKYSLFSLIIIAFDNKQICKFVIFVKKS